MLAIERRNYILKVLHETGRVQVTELSKELGVSRMTIHRDLDALAQKGQLEKVFGGAALKTIPKHDDPPHACELCGRPVHARTRVTLRTKSGDQIEACCPHCGLQLLEERDDIVSGMAIDFMHGKMINLKAATFLVNPDVIVCCAPPVICFADKHDAQRFQIGFNGRLAKLNAARDLVASHMDLSIA